MNYRVLTLLFWILISCNTNIKKEYYSNGNLKELKYYGKKNSQSDSMIVYFEEYKGIPKSIITLKEDSVYYQKKYYQNGRIESEGYYINNENFKIGKWEFHNIKGYKESVMEYMNIRNKSYLNQSWTFNKEGDTLYGDKGHFYETNLSDTLKLDKVNRIQFFLKEPFLSSQSQVYILLPKDEESLNKYFYNEKFIEWDTIKNVALRYKNKKYINYNLNVVFDIQPMSSGKKKLKGIILEKGKLPNDKSKLAIRKIYFNIPYYVN